MYENWLTLLCCWELWKKVKKHRKETIVHDKRKDGPDTRVFSFVFFYFLFFFFFFFLFFCFRLSFHVATPSLYMEILLSMNLLSWLHTLFRNAWNSFVRPIRGWFKPFKMDHPLRWYIVKFYFNNSLFHNKIEHMLTNKISTI